MYKLLWEDIGRRNSPLEEKEALYEQRTALKDVQEFTG